MSEFRYPSRSEAAPTEFTVQPGTMTDIDAMSIVLQRAHSFRDSEPANPVLNDVESLVELQERINYPGAWSFLAFDNSRLAGFVLGHSSSVEKTVTPDKDTDFLALLMTDPDYWGVGIGSTLLDTAADSARANGKKHLVLCAEADNLRAIRLYTRKNYYLTEGFRQISKRQKPLRYYRRDLLEV